MIDTIALGKGLVPSLGQLERRAGGLRGRRIRNTKNAYGQGEGGKAEGLAGDGKAHQGLREGARESGRVRALGDVIGTEGSLRGR